MEFTQRKAELAAVYGQSNGRLGLPAAGVAVYNIIQSFSLRIIHRSVQVEYGGEAMLMNAGIETEGEPAGCRVCETTGLSPESAK